MRRLIFAFLLTILSLTGIRAQYNTFRISYDIANFDLVGSVVMATDSDYVIAGTNATFIPLYGNVFKVDQQGNIVWAKEYVGGVATDMQDIANVSTGGYIVGGSSDASGAMLMRLDANGNVTWANGYDKSNANTEGVRRAIETSDGGFVAAGTVSEFDPDGTGPLPRFDSSNVYMFKTNSSGTLLWGKVIMITTAFDNDHVIHDVAEVSDGYVFVGYTSESDTSDNGNALLIKTDFNGNLQWVKEYGNTGEHDELTSAVTLPSGEVLVGGVTMNDRLFLLRIDATGSVTWAYTYDSGSFLGTDQAINFDAFLTNDNKYASIGMFVQFGLPPVIGSYLVKIEPSNGSLIFQKFYNGGLSSLTPEGLQVSDNGYMIGMMSQQFTGFNYHLIKTDPNGDLLDTACSNSTLSLTASAASPTFTAMSPTEYTGVTRNGFSPLVNTISPTQVIDCQTIVCTPPATPTASASPSTTICEGESITISGSGSGANVIYNVYDADTLGNLLGTTPLTIIPGAGTTTYYVEAQDTTTGCVSIDRDSVTITVNPKPTASITGNDTICLGDNTTLTASGGGTYSWNTGATTTSITVSPTTNTTYQVIVTSSAGCQDTATIDVAVLSPPTAAITGPTTTCSNEPVTLTASGGGTYSWNTGETTANITVNPSTTTTYSVIVTTGTCSDTAYHTLNVNTAPTASISASTNPVCVGDTAVLTASGGVSYLWSTSETTSTINVTPSTATTYQVIVTDGNGCQDTTQITMNVNPQTVVGATANPGTTVCENTSITLNGTGANTYVWDNGVTDGVAFTITSTTTYTVIGTDVNGCKDTAQITVNVNPLPAITISGNDTICQGDNTTLTASGGTSYTWSTGANGNSITVSPATTTTYIVTGTDANGCSNNDTLDVVVLPPPTALINGVANGTTANCSNEVLTLSASGGGTYSWNTGANSSSINVQPNTSTTYTVVVTVGSCSDTTSHTVTVNTAPTAGITGNTTVCEGDTTTLSGQPTAGVNYLWSTGATSSSITISVSSPTTVSLIVTDNNGCKDTANVTVNTNPLPVITISGNDSICLGDSTNLSASGGIAYLWNSGEVTSSIYVNPSTTTAYTVTGTDANGCSNTAQFTVNVLPPPTATISGDTSVCAGNSVVLTASGGGSYSWNTGETTATISPIPTTTTTYNVVVSIGSCSDTAYHTVNIQPMPAINISNDTTIILGQSGELFATGGDNVTWFPSTGLSCSTCETTEVTPEETTTYCAAVSLNGCVDTACVLVTVDIVCGEVFVPNAFSPNGDGANETVKVYNNCIKTMVFRIFNRWGEVVFETTDPTAEWDGTFKGKPLNSGVFVYTLNAQLIDGTEVDMKGNISLIK